MKVPYLAKEQRKKIIFLSDDLRLNSGVATMSRELILGTAGYFNWVQIGSAINHPEVGKIIDLSADCNKQLGITDASVIMYPSNGYGTPDFLRTVIKRENPDAIVHFTDPRYWIWLYSMAHEIRTKIPIVYYTIWDDLPYPRWNKPYYQSCDLLLCISKQTENIVKNVLPLGRTKDWQVSYLPHGINHNNFRPIQEQTEIVEMNMFRDNLFKGKQYDFVALHNNRNIRRKMTSDVILAFRSFVDKLKPAEADKCVLVLHTQPIDENGTDLPEVVKRLAPNINVIFSDQRYDDRGMNFLYNIADVTINIASNEGWGLSSTESMLAGTPIINNVTGGLQDQCRFTDENDKWIEFSEDFPSNHTRVYENHGAWCTPVFPKTRSLQGSLPTPYIFDDRCDWQEVGIAIRGWYNMSRENRKQLGALGREWAMSDEAGFTADKMSLKFQQQMENLFLKWKPINRYEVINTNEKEQFTTGDGVIY